MIWAMVLAAGMARRMGQPKLLLPFGKATIIESVLNHVRASNIDRTMVVLGANHRRIKKKIKDLPLTVIINPFFSNGMLSSVICGFEAMPADVQAVVMVLGDQPTISSKTVNTLIDQYKKTKKGIILPVYRGQRGHPILIDIKYKKKIRYINPSIGLRELIHNHPEDILEVNINNISILHDIDTPDDYHKAMTTETGKYKKK